MKVLFLFLLACGDDAAPPVPDAGVADGGSDAGAPDAGADAGELCGTAAGALPPGLTALSYFSGDERRRLDDQTWSITLESGTYVLADQPAWELARFEVDRPTTIRAVTVQWMGAGDVPPEEELLIGLYDDFGYNGFDAWTRTALWTGTRCAKDVNADGTVTYVLSEPIEIAQPGLVYVGHYRLERGLPTFAFDTTSDDPEGDCPTFDSCRASLNLARVKAFSYFNGTTLQIPYDFVVTLHVEQEPAVPDAEKVFAIDPSVTGATRASFGDYDGDGFDDLLLPGPRLLRNVAGAFEDVTAASGIAASGVSGGGGVFGDYDNDGCLDLYVFNDALTQSDGLLHNECDGTFTNATASSGIADVQSYETCDEGATTSPSPAAAWIDLDADSFLDLYVSTYECNNGRSFYDLVYHNEGDGTFTEWTAMHGFSDIRTPSRGAAPIDFDRDGDVDLMVNNYRLVRNLFYENLGGGMVRERAREIGLAGIEEVAGGWYGHTIGVAWGDLDNDADFDTVHANLAHPRFYDFSDKTQVLLQTAGRFMDNAGDWREPRGASGLRFQETHSSPVLADFDSDGDLDLVITAVYEGRPTDFYWGDGDGTFTLDVLRAGITTENGWGAAASDYDHDGDVDLVATSLFENRMATTNHWLAVRVVGGPTSNRAAIGATVAVRSGGVTRLRHVQGGSGQGCQDSGSLHFGLGAATTVESIEVTFPGGLRVSYPGPIAIDQQVWLFEDGRVHRGFAPPP
jgi:hypothetical protein